MIREASRRPLIRTVLATVVLISGCSGQAIQEPSAYRYTHSEAAWMVGDDSHRYAVIIPRTRHVWIGDDGSGRLLEERRSPLFLGPNDRAEWGDSAMPIPAHVDQTFGRDEMAVVDLAELPDTPEDVRRKLVAQGDEDEPDAVAVLTGALVYLRETVPAPATAELLYRVIASQHGIGKIDALTDHAGRAGEGFFVEIHAKSDAGELNTRLVVIFDADTHALLEEQSIQLNSNPGVDAQPPVMIGWATYLTSATVPNTEIP